MYEPLWLRRDVLLLLHRRMIAEHGGEEGLRDEGLFDSALARPRQKLSYVSGDVASVAASYGWALIRNHAFVDGNKRVAAMATILFLELNGADFIAPEAEVVVVFETLAAGKMNEAAFAEWVRANARRRSRK